MTEKEEIEKLLEALQVLLKPYFKLNEGEYIDICEIHDANDDRSMAILITTRKK